MEILFWLLPAVVATSVAMIGVAWFGREHREDLEPEEAARRIGEALERQADREVPYAAERRTAEPGTGVKVRRIVRVAAEPDEQAS